MSWGVSLQFNPKNDVFRILEIAKQNHVQLSTTRTIMNEMRVKICFEYFRYMAIGLGVMPDPNEVVNKMKQIIAILPKPWLTRYAHQNQENSVF